MPRKVPGQVFQGAAVGADQQQRAIRLVAKIFMGMAAHFSDMLLRSEMRWLLSQMVNWKSSLVNAPGF